MNSKMFGTSFTAVLFSYLFSRLGVLVVGSDEGVDMATMPASVSMQTLLNASVIVCSDVMNMPMARMVEMSDEQLLELYEAKGGNYVRDYMATTEEEALDNFPNMLIITSPVTVPGKHSDFSVLDNMIVKKIIMEDLQRLMSFLTNNTSAHQSPPAPTVRSSTDKPLVPPSTFHSNAASHTSSKSVPTSSPDVYTKPDRTSTRGVYVTPNIPSNKSPTPVPYHAPPKGPYQTPSNPEPTTYPVLRPNGPSTTGSPGQTPSLSTLDPEVAKGLDQLNMYVKGNGVVKRDLSALWREVNTALHPSYLMGLAFGNRKKRNADGSFTREEYCTSKGSQTDDGKFIHLCSICAATTRLPESYFPRYINEAICKTDDTDCFIVGGTAHGQCKQTMFSLNMLRKKSGQCQMLLHGGENLVFDEWELVPTKIRVACECTINKLSAFSTYVGQSSVIGR